ncbi:MAG: hypothetical protein KAT17_00260, partial [Candidatus Aminicenantes bacterium]|nr:hypothetical protein [Candidatus Aminicenantes bacterium]
VPKRYTIDLDSPGTHHSLKLKFNFEDSLGKHNGKILMKYDDRKAKILFLSPLNQVYFKLLVEKNKSLLINTKEKKYWEGNFKCLIKEMWRIDLSFKEFRLLVQEGIIPQQKLAKFDLKFLLEKDNKTGKPKKIKLFNDEISIQLKIQNRKIKRGIIQFHLDLSALQKSDINDVITAE